MWVEILLDKYFTYRPTERLLASWRLLGLDLAAGTVTDGLQRLEVLLRPIYEALKQRNPQGDLHQGDETRWRVFVPLEGKEGYGWWLWLVKGLDTVIYLLDPSRGHTVVENHFGAQSRGVLVVDRYAAYKAMSWVKDGVIVLAFCWSHVRRDFIRVGKGWPELKTWALEWLRRIRLLYRLNDRRLAVQQDAAAFGEADGCLRQAVAEMKTQMETELARADLATPCRKALESLRAHWEGLTRFVDDPRIPMDNNTSERLERGPAVARKNFYGSGSLWSGQLTAALFSILATLSLWKLNPRKWLTWYFEHCAAAGGKVPEDIQPFLPWNLSEERKKELGEPGLAEGDDTFLDRQDAASRRPHFSHHASEDPVPPRGTLDRFLLRTEQTGWSVVYTLFRKEITILVRSKHKAMNLVTAIISMSCGRLKNDVRVIVLLSRAILSRCKPSILLGLQHE